MQKWNFVYDGFELVLGMSEEDKVALHAAITNRVAGGGSEWLTVHVPDAGTTQFLVAPGATFAFVSHVVDDVEAMPPKRKSKFKRKHGALANVTDIGALRTPPTPPPPAGTSPANQ